MVQAGDPLPDFQLTAAGSGAAVSPALFAGKPGLVVLHGAKNSEPAKEVSKALRARHKDPSAVPFVSIVDLRAFGGIWKKVAEAQLRSTYEKLAAKAKENGFDPAVAVVIAADWDGAVCARFGVPAPDEAPLAVAVGPGGKVTGTASAKDAAAAVALLG